TALAPWLAITERVMSTMCLAAVRKLVHVPPRSNWPDGQRLASADAGTAPTTAQASTIHSVLRQPTARPYLSPGTPVNVAIRPDGYIAHITERRPDGIDAQTLSRLAPARTGRSAPE